MRYLLIVEYDGTAYGGWQKNPGCDTIEDRLEAAVCKAAGETCALYASGRTDAGVHAEAQTAHFDVRKALDEKKFPREVNAFLPSDIRVKSIKSVSQNFHARLNVKSKTYIYRCYVGTVESPLRRLYFARIPFAPDYAKMREAAAVICGKHDFSAFCSTRTEADDCVREIISVDILHRGDELTFIVRGKAFLYNMVRIITGTLLAVGRGKLLSADVSRAFSTGDRRLTGETMPACGLCLHSVEY